MNSPLRLAGALLSSLMLVGVATAQCPHCKPAECGQPTHLVPIKGLDEVSPVAGHTCPTSITIEATHQSWKETYQATRAPSVAEMPLFDPAVVGLVQQFHVGWMGPLPYVWNRVAANVVDFEPLTEELSEPVEGEVTPSGTPNASTGQPTPPVGVNSDAGLSGVIEVIPPGRHGLRLRVEKFGVELPKNMRLYLHHRLTVDNPLNEALPDLRSKIRE